MIEFFSHQVRESDNELLSMIADVGLKIGQFGERTRAEEALRQTEAQLRQAQKWRPSGGLPVVWPMILTIC